jgi:adenylylsulfate kinase
MGLSGAGKTTLADAIKSKLVTTGHTVHRLSADEVRREHDDWDFSTEGRLRQGVRMRALADASDAAYVVCDFIAPLPEMRETFGANITIWVDTIRECEYADTNEMFVPPATYDLRVTSQDSDAWTEKVITILAEKRTTS